MNMTPKIQIVTQEEIRKNRKSKLIIGIQAGLFGYVLRLGLYTE